MTQNKPKNIFARKKDVIAEKKKLAILSKERRNLEIELKNILDIYDLSQFVIKRMPISSFFILFISLHKTNSDGQIELFELRDNIRKEHKEKIDRLEELITQMKAVKIDLALAKIKCIESELDK